MRATDALRERLAAAGAELPLELLDLIIAVAGPLVTALDDASSLPGLVGAEAKSAGA